MSIIYYNLAHKQEIISDAETRDKETRNCKRNIVLEKGIVVQYTRVASLRDREHSRGYLMNIVVIDGQGGQLGAQLVKEISAKFQNIDLTAIGTNSVATATMLKAGARSAATGENPVIVACRRADIIIGPIGIVIADSLLGEVTEQMAVAVGKADAVRILIPMNKCENLVAGVPTLNTATLISDAIEKVNQIIASRK